MNTPWLLWTCGTLAGVNCTFEYISLRASWRARLRLRIFASAALSWEPFASRSRRCRKITIFVSILSYKRACGRFEKHARRLPLVRYIIQCVILCQNANRHRHQQQYNKSRDIIMRLTSSSGNVRLTSSRENPLNLWLLRGGELATGRWEKSEPTARFIWKK